MNQLGQRTQGVALKEGPPALASQSAWDSPSNSRFGSVKTNKTVIHPFSALLLVLIDSLWTVSDWVALLWLFTVPLSFIATAIPTFLIQSKIHQDPPSKAALIAAFLGVLAALPTPIAGTLAGSAVLGWAGLKRLKFRGKSRWIP